MTGELGDLGRRDACVQPSRHGGMTQIVGVLGERRGVLRIAESSGAGCIPNSIGGPGLDWVAAELNDRPRKRLAFKKLIEQIGPLLLR